jgi:hypothetical protein
VTVLQVNSLKINLFKKFKKVYYFSAGAETLQAKFHQSLWFLSVSYWKGFSLEGRWLIGYEFWLLVGFFERVCFLIDAHRASR